MNPLVFLCGSLVGLALVLLAVAIVFAVLFFKTAKERDMVVDKLENLGYTLYLQYRQQPTLPLFRDLTSVEGDPPNSRRFAVVTFLDTSSGRRTKFMVDGTRVEVCE
ncbi:MAG: hypothetical protein WC702_00605 [Patescibacteria group bacterium]|jgi:hypothetical protein